MNQRLGIAALALLVAIAPLCAADTPPEISWRTRLERQLPLLGQSNWIVIADSACPWKTAAGIETINTEEEQLAVVKGVLNTLGTATHVSPAVLLDAELPHVPEDGAKGIGAYRDGLKKLLAGREVQYVPHEQLMARLDEAGKTFHVLLLKTKLAMPYTTVFLPLESSYWDTKSEQKLREALKAK